MELRLKAGKIWYYQEVVDFRKSIDGLLCLIHSHMKMKPTEGLFIFRNRRKDKLKLLAWHGNGFVLLYKRLERGKFTTESEGESILLDEEQLSWLLAGLDWAKMRNWDTLSYDDYY